MRITLLHYSCPPIIGGVEQVLATHARLFAENNYSTQVLVGSGSNFDERVRVTVLPELHSRHDRVQQIKASLDQGIIPADFHPFRTHLLNELRARLSDEDVLIAHNVCSLQKHLALTAAIHDLAAERPRQVIFWHHDFAWSAKRYQNEIFEGFPWSLTKELPPYVRHVTISEARRRELCDETGLSPDKVCVVPQGIDILSLTRAGRQTREVLGHGAPVDAYPLLVLPVRITRRKNIELAIATVGELRERWPTVRLIVTGPLGNHNVENQSYFDELVRLTCERGLESHVTFLAEKYPHGVEKDTIGELLTLADVLLFPSFEEGFGIPLLEAAVSKTPIVCSDIPVFQEVTGGYARFIDPHGSAVPVAKAVEAVLNESGAQARRRIVEQFQWQAVFTQQMLPLLKSLEGTQ